MALDRWIALVVLLICLVYGYTLAMAMFALPEAMYLVLDPACSRAGGKERQDEIKRLRITRREAREIAPVVGRQSVEGFLIGVLPGAGATIASFLGYAVERNIAPKEEREAFGKGSIKGLAAPEAANNAACTGSFVPLLTLGIPGSGTTAILLGALIALNVAPGPRLMVDQPQIFWAVIISMYLGNLILLILNLPLIPYIAKVPAVPRAWLIPFILFFTLMGAWIGQNNATELLLVGLGFCATILRFADHPLAPLLIGFILGRGHDLVFGLVEVGFRLAVRLHGSEVHLEPAPERAVHEPDVHGPPMVRWDADRPISERRGATSRTGGLVWHTHHGIRPRSHRHDLTEPPPEPTRCGSRVRPP